MNTRKEVYEDIKDLASEIGVKTAYDDLSSDVSNFYPTGTKSLDIVLGGGVPCGKVIELSGWESSGKSAIALTFSKAFTEFWDARGERNCVLWIEAESAFDKARAKYFGCNLDRYMMVEALDVEEAFKTMENAIEASMKKKFKLFIVLDTIAALQTNKERESGEYAGGIAQKPRVVKQCLQKLVPLLGKSDTTLILVNQVYTTLNSYGGAGAESPGGGGIKFFSSIRGAVTVRKKDTGITSSGEEYTKAILTEVFTKKNKITLPQQKCLLYIYGDKGIDSLNTSYEFCLKNKIFQGAAWKTYNTTRMLDGVATPLEIKFQNVKQLVEKSMAESINIHEYLDYEVTKCYTEASPFIKVKYIDELWNFELSHFGQKVSTLTKEEEELATVILNKVINDELEVSNDNIGTDVDLYNRTEY